MTALLGNLRCGHPECPGAGTWRMYSAKSGRYYRCWGSGAERHGCGNPMVPAEALERLVLDAEYWNSVPYLADDSDAHAALEDLRANAAAAVRSAPLGAVEAALRRYADHAADIESRADLSVADALRSLDRAGQRELLGRYDIKAWRDGEGIHATAGGNLLT